MDVATRFVGGGQEYAFTPDHQISLVDNFRNARLRMSQLPGVSGGYDEYGDDAAPGEVGSVQLSFWVHADTPVQMRARLDALGQMADWGLLRLYKTTMDGGERFCEARLQNLTYSQKAAELPRKRMQVQVTFSVPNPVWLTLSTEEATWGGGQTWGGGAIWGGSANPATLVDGVSSEITVSVGGNAAVQPRILITAQSGESCEDVALERVVDGQVADRVAYEGVLTDSDELEIDCRGLTVTLNGADAYGDAFAALRGRWMRLMAGPNVIRVVMANASDAASVRVLYNEAYR
jgi:hypothetical protein